MRSIVSLGAPLEVDGKRYKNSGDNSFEQSKLAADNFLLPYKTNVESKYGKPDNTGFRASVFCFALEIEVWLNLLLADALFALGAAAFVFLYFVFHLRSCFMALIGMSLILMSFPLTVLICKGIFQVTYISSLHVLAVFIVLGIAADDVFVFIDAWRQSEKILPPEIASDKRKRMAYTFRRASRAMSVTSSTTMAAFIANIFSPLMPIKSFGIYAGIIVPMQFFLVVAIFPSAVIVYEDFFGSCCDCLGSAKQVQMIR